MKRILVTGGAGFIGSNFVHYMLGAHPSYLIVNYDKLTYAGNLDNLKSVAKHKQYRFVKGDICNKKRVAETIKKYKIDTIVHFAAETHVDRSIISSSEFTKTNVVGTEVLLQCAVASKIKRFHHVSTDEVFGSLSLKDKAFCESTPLNPQNPYSVTKAASDFMALVYGKVHGLPVTVSNCSNNYGPYQFPEKLIPKAIIHAMGNKKIPLYGKGTNIRDWLYVVDHCRAIDLILHKGKIGQRYCIGGNNQVRNKDILSIILTRIGKDKSLIKHVADRKNHDYRYDINISFIKKSLGWKPSVSFEKGIDHTVSWYLDNKDWWKKLSKRRDSLL